MTTTVLIDDFESGTPGAEPPGWTVSKSGVNPEWISALITLTPHSGAQSCSLYNDNGPGSYIKISKNVDLTNAINLKLWHRYSGADWMTSPVVRIDSMVVWSEIDNTSQTYAEIIIDVSSYTGIHEVSFSMEAPAT